MGELEIIFSALFMIFLQGTILMWVLRKIVKKTGEIQSDIYRFQLKLMENSRDFSEIRQQLSEMEIRISNQMNGRFHKLEERERELNARTIFLEYKKEETSFPRKRGRPPKY